MAKYIYKPMSKDEYLKNYVDTLKTGELLVDLGGNFDVYVTEEGVNIPIPITEELRKEALDVVANTNKYGLKVNEIGQSLTDLIDLREKMELKQEDLFQRLETIYGRYDDAYNKTVYLQKVTKDNINQLGDIRLEFEDLDVNGTEEIIRDYVNRFNTINNDHTFQTDIESTNKQLLEIWTNIQNLLADVNKKLNKLGSFSGNIKITQITTKEVKAYDVSYSNFMFNNTYGDAQYSSRVAYANRSNSLIQNGTNWFNATSSWQNINGLCRYDYDGGPGTNIYYRGFSYKRNIASGNESDRYYDWDALEGIALKGNFSWDLGTWDYLRNPSSWIMQPYGSVGWGVTSNSFLTKVKGVRATNPLAVYDNGTIFGSFRLPNSTYDIDLDRMTVKVNDNQKKPRSIRPASSPYSTVVPSYPVIVKQRLYVSSTGIVNRESYTFRIGCSKTIRETVIKNKILNYNNTVGWS